MKLVLLILIEIIKIVTTFGWSSAGGACSAPPDPLTGLEGLLRVRGGSGRGKGNGYGGRAGRGSPSRGGKGFSFPTPLSPFFLSPPLPPFLPCPRLGRARCCLEWIPGYACDEFCAKIAASRDNWRPSDVIAPASPYCRSPGWHDS